MDIKKSQNELSRISLESGTIYLNLSNAFPILIDELTAASRNDEKQVAFKRLKTDLEKILSMESVLFDKKDEKGAEAIRKDFDKLTRNFPYKQELDSERAFMDKAPKGFKNEI